MKKLTKFLALSILAIFVTACNMDVSSNSPDTTDPFLAPVSGISADYQSTWVNDDYGFHSEYQITASSIKDVAMNCEFIVISSSSVTSSDGCLLVFTQCKRGTDFTPAGYFYVVALKLSNSNLSISCPIDYSERYTSVSALQEVYTEFYSVSAHGNYFTNCRDANSSEPQPVTLTDSTGYMTQIKFEKGKASLLMMGASGWGTYDSFTAKRDTTKENSNVLLYLYSESDRTYARDLHYLKVKSDGSVYYYLYDDDEEDNDATIDMCNSGYMPVVSSQDLTNIFSLYD